MGRCASTSQWGLEANDPAGTVGAQALALAVRGARVHPAGTNALRGPSSVAASAVLIPARPRAVRAQQRHICAAWVTRRGASCGAPAQEQTQRAVAAMTFLAGVAVGPVSAVAIFAVPDGRVSACLRASLESPVNPRAHHRLFNPPAGDAARASSSAA